MSGFDFSSIGNIISELFDSDYIDIKRNVAGKLQEIYSNVPCHIAYNSTDNPDPNSIDTKPIVQSLTIHTSAWVDLNNDDFIVAKKMSSDGKILAVYSGRCGNPVVSQGRKKIVMGMQGTESDEPTIPPITPSNPSKITISFTSNGIEIKESVSVEVEIGSNYILNPYDIEGYNVTACYIDDIEQDNTTVEFEVVNDSYNIRFEYESVSMPVYFRYLVNGLYTKDDGRLANGYHLYKKIPLISISKNEQSYSIVCKDEVTIQSDSGLKLEIVEGAKIVLFPQNIFVKVDLITGIEDGNVKFLASEFIPSEQEKNAYVTGWYDGL